MNEHITQAKLPPNIKACIALTSWKARIDTVGMTIFNLLHMCGDQYHVVLTLSADEFPQKEASLPKDLNQMLAAGLFELIWVTKNYKSFKKWIFCALRYPTVPIISADDDCIYLFNYADVLYSRWLEHNENIYTYHKCKFSGYQHGPATLYPPSILAKFCIDHLNDEILNTNHDDVYTGMCANLLNIPIIEVDPNVPYKFHDTICALSDGSTLPTVHAMQHIYNVLQRGDHEAV